MAGDGREGAGLTAAGDSAAGHASITHDQLPRAMTHTASDPDRHSWLHFATRSGEEGRRWAEEYRRDRSVEELSEQSLLLLRRRRYEEGNELLARAAESLEAVQGPERSVRSVMERWYYGVLGYSLYCLDEFDRAEQVMMQAHEAVTAAVGEHRVLLPLANHCHEFRLHRARIARNRCRWEEMRSHVEEVRGMLEGRLPFCVLQDGSPVWISTIRAFHTSLPGLTEEERGSLSGLLEDAVLLRHFEQFVHGMYRVPGVVIPYP